MKKREVIFSQICIGFSIDNFQICTTKKHVKSTDILSIFLLKILYKSVKKNFSLFHEIPSTLKSSLEKTTDRI